MSLLVIGAFMWRLIDLQLMPDPELAAGIGTRIVDRPISAPRGEIVDRHGRPMALSLPAPTVIAEPRLISLPLVPAVVAKLTPVLSTDPGVLTGRLDGDGYFAYLERQVDHDVGQAIDDLRIAGVTTIEEPRREHPNGECSGISVVGRVDVDHVGISGLEEQFDSHLTGVDGHELSEASADGRNTIPGGRQVVDAALPGDDLLLTLDRNIQFQAEKLIAEAVETTGGDLGMIVISVPATGEIIAMANAKRNDSTGEVRCTTTNLSAVWSYEPGSVMKPFTVSSLLDGDPALTNETIEVPYSITRDDGAAGKVFRDPWLHEPVEMSLTEIVSKSSNVGAVLVAEQSGSDALHQTLVDFGFGARTALGFKGEASGILNSLDLHSLGLSSVAIGQGIAVTPLQLLTAYNTFGNQGFKPDPIVVLDGTSSGEEVLSSSVADSVLAMMRAVVADGTGGAGAIPGYEVAGKTGTAWQPCSIGFGYECEGGGRHYTATFAGIVSNDSGPALSAVVVVDNPKKDLGAYSGGAVSAPVFSEIAAYALRQLRIAPIGDPGMPQDRVRAEPATAPIVPLPTQASS